MSSAKKTIENEEEVVDDAVETGGESDSEDKETVEPSESEDKAEIKKPASTGKRPLGTKEVIPFAWKLVGTSQGVALTLFKAVDRADVEAQHERVNREGYYTDLRILDVNEKVKQPKPVKPPKPVKATTTRRGAKATKAAARTPPKASTKRRLRCVCVECSSTGMRWMRPSAGV